MKVFRIEANICYWDATKHFPSVESTMGFFPPNLLFVEAPDYVFEGWGYDELQTGDDRFIKPIAPEGWAYDEKTGTFYNEKTAEEFGCLPLVPFQSIGDTHMSTEEYKLREFQNSINSVVNEI